MRNGTWTQSEPPRGSGWVPAQRFSIGAYGVPTRYREVVLTVSKYVSSCCNDLLFCREHLRVNFEQFVDTMTAGVSLSDRRESVDCHLFRKRRITKNVADRLLHLFGVSRAQVIFATAE